MPQTYTAAVGPATKLNQSQWVRNELIKAPAHEAGHAVIARILGFPVAWVSVDSNFINSDPLAIENGSTGMGPVCMTISSDRLKPILERGWITTKAERDTILGYMKHVMAGPMVEYGIDSASFERELSGRDLEQATAVLAMAVPDKSTRKKLHKQAVRELDQLLNEHWDVIIHVAEAIQERGTLMADELDAMIWDDGMQEAA